MWKISCPINHEIVVAVHFFRLKKYQPAGPQNQLLLHSIRGHFEGLKTRFLLKSSLQEDHITSHHNVWPADERYSTTLLKAKKKSQPDSFQMPPTIVYVWMSRQSLRSAVKANKIWMKMLGNNFRAGHKPQTVSQTTLAGNKNSF